MGNIFYVMGKSASGKDTIYKMLKQRYPELRTVVIYTTRPIRDGEREGVEYHFTDEAGLSVFRQRNQVIEERTYQTVYGPWTYFTVDDGQFDLEHGCYLMIGTLESYEKMRAYFGQRVMVPIYINVENGLRLQRALDREKMQQEPKYKELCRRFLADEDDFSEENMLRCGIEKRYENRDLEACVEEIVRDIKYCD